MQFITKLVITAYVTHKVVKTVDRINNNTTVSFIWNDCMKPEAKEMISTIVQETTDRILYGEAASRSRTKTHLDYSYANYNRNSYGRRVPNLNRTKISTDQVPVTSEEKK